MGADYAVDVYPQYGSDVEATLRSGADIRHGLIGAGVYASHGYERSQDVYKRQPFSFLCIFSICNHSREEGLGGNIS